MSQSNIWLRLAEFGVLAGALTPLAFSSHFMYPLVFPRVMVFRAIAVLTVLAWFAASRRDPRLRIDFRSPLASIWLAFLGVQTIAGILGVNPYASFASSISRGDGIVTLAHLVAFGLVGTALLRDQRRRKRLLAAVVGMLALQALLGLAQAANLPGVPLFSSDRPTGLTGNPSYYATLMVFGVWLPLVLAALPAAPGFWERRRRLAWYAIAVGCALALWLTQIRGAILSTLIVGVVVLAYGARRAATPVLRRRAGITLAALSVIIAAAWMSRNTALVAWDRTLKRVSETTLSAITVQNRLLTWGTGLRAFRQHPFLGWGPENFSVAFDRYFNPLISRDFGSFSWYDRAHSTIIETLVGSGAVGLAFYLFIYGIAGWLLVRWSKDPTLRPATPFLAALIATHFLTLQTTFDTISSAIVWYLLLATMAAAVAVTPAAVARRTAHFSLLPAVSIASVLLAVGVVLPTFSTWFASRVALQPDLPLTAVTSDFQRALRMTPPQRQEFRQVLGNLVLAKLRTDTLPPHEQFDPLVDLALDHLRRSVAADPDNLQTQLILSELARLLAPGNPELVPVARQAAAEVVARAPARYHGYFAVGRVAMTTGNPQEGVAAFRQAVIRYPELAAAHWNLGIAYLLDHQPDAAVRAAAVAKQLDPSLYFSRDNLDKLGRAFADQGYLQPAAALYREAADRQPTDAEWFRRLSHLYRQLDQPELAQAAARRAIELNPVLSSEFSALEL
ncbi:MAG: O-antigen ligase family protein [bacterium]|nr:O-antigen ligase family protein [bacterium]